MRFLLLFSLFSFATAWAQDGKNHDQDEWLARRGGVEVSTEELNQYMITVPEEHRPGVMQSRKRVGEILNGLLLNEQIVKDAIAAGMENDSKVKVEFERARQRVLIQAWMQKVGDDEAMGDVEQLAYEQYLISQSQYMVPESVDVTHLLVSTKQRSEAEARKLAEEIHSKLLAGELDFDQAVKMYSEDPSSSNNNGNFPAVRRGQMVKPFEEAAFSMNEAGSFSPIVQTEFGFHIIRFNQRHEERPLSFDEIKGNIIDQMRSKLASDARAKYQAKLESIEPVINEAAIQSVMEVYRPVSQ